MDVSQEELMQIRQLEERLHRPETRKSAEAVEKLLAHGFVEFGSSGTVYDNKDDLIALLAAERPDLASPPVIACDYGFRTISSDAVLVTYRTIQEMKDRGPPRHVLRSSIWQRIDGRWQMIFHQGTPTSPRP